MNIREQATGLGIKVDGRWSDDRVQQEIDNLSNAKHEGSDVPPESPPAEVAATPPPVNKFTTLEWANERAAAVWNGQSPNLSILERVGRIKIGLGDKGFTDFKKLTLPTNLDYKRYL